MSCQGFFNITDKVAIVTGGASRIGKAISELYLEKGAKVAIFDLIDHLEDIAKELNAKNAIGVKCDVTNNESMDLAI